MGVLARFASWLHDGESSEVGWVYGLGFCVRPENRSTYVLLQGLLDYVMAFARCYASYRCCSTVLSKSFRCRLCT